MVAFEEIAEQYVTATGDTAGVKTVNGAVVLDCWQDSAVRVSILWRGVPHPKLIQAYSCKEAEMSASTTGRRTNGGWLQPAEAIPTIVLRAPLQRLVWGEMH